MIEIRDIASLFGLLKLGVETYKAVRGTAAKGTSSIRKSDFEGASSPLAEFKGEKVSLFMSSLFAPPPIPTAEGTLYFLYSTCGNALSPVGSGCLVTGLSDALGLAKLAVALVQQASEFTYELEENQESIQNNHLIFWKFRVLQTVARLVCCFENFRRTQAGFQKTIRTAVTHQQSLNDRRYIESEKIMIIELNRVIRYRQLCSMPTCAHYRNFYRIINSSMCL